MMFAEAMPDPVTYAGWLGCLAFTIWILNGGTKLLRNWRGLPLPEQLEARIKALEGHHTEAMNHRRTMEAQLTVALSDIGSLKSTTDMQTQLIHRTDTNVQRLVEHLLNHRKH